MLKMKFKVGLKPLFNLLIIALRSKHKWSLIKSLVSKNWLISSKSNYSLITEFLLGSRDCYAGLMVTNNDSLKCALYSRINKGRVEEVGSLNLKSSKMKEFYSKLRRKGDVIKVLNYELKNGVVTSYPL